MDALKEEVVGSSCGQGHAAAMLLLLLLLFGWDEEMMVEVSAQQSMLGLNL